MNAPPFEYDGPALDNLDEQMIEYRGGTIKLTKPLAFYHPHVLAAIRYLCDEWDYGYEIHYPQVS